MSDLRIVKGNDFATLYTIRAMYADGTIVEDFDLRACTDVQVIVHRTYSKSVASLLNANEYGSYSLEPENVLRINWDGLLVKLGTYTVDFRAKFRGADIRSYSIKDLIFDIVETNEEANIPAGAFVDNGVYVFSGDFVLMFESQVQADWDESNTSSPAYIKNKPTIPSSLAELSEDAEHRTVTDAEIAEWNAKQDAIADIDEIRSGAAAGATAYQLPATGIPKAELSEQVQASLAKADTAYQKPSTGIPASDIASGVIPDVSQFITRNVNDLVNYYLKSETYSKAEVQGLIAAINQFHYEIYPSTSAVTNPQGNVLYLIGPTGTGADKYEEYVYANNTWVKIGDTSIDLSGYVTTQALNAALANYTTTANLNTLLAQKQDVLTFDNVPTEGSTNPVTSEGLHDVFEQIYEDYAKKDGFYENMLVGSALNLTDTTGAYIAREFYFSPAGGTNDIKTGSAFIKRIKGSTIVWNQLVNRSKFYGGQNSQMTESQGVYTVTATANTSRIYTLVESIIEPLIGIDHKYYFESSFSINAQAEPVRITIEPRWYRSDGSNTNSPWVTSLSNPRYDGTKITSSTIFDSSTLFFGTEHGGAVSIKPSIAIYRNNTDYVAGDYFKVYSFKMIDLTLMFGAGNEPATVAEFEAMFPLDYYDYNAGQLLSFTGDDIKTTGFNQWDEQNIDIGAYTVLGGITASGNYANAIHTTSYIRCFQQPYYLYCGNPNMSKWYIPEYDANKQFLRRKTVNKGRLYTPSNDAYYFRFSTEYDYGSSIYNYDICINISHNGTKNGTYEEYEQHTKDISFYKSIKDGQGNTLFPYGLLSAGSVYDEVTATKAIKRIGAVDMGTLNWGYNSYRNAFIVKLSTFKKVNAYTLANIICSKYETQKEDYLYYNYTTAIGISSANGFLAVTTNADIAVVEQTYTTTAAFKTAMQGVMLYYELAEPVVVDITEQNMAYLVNDWGTEQLLPENTSAPVTTPAMMHVIYGMNAVDTLRNLPKNFLAQADLDRLLTAEGYTFTKTWNVDTQQWNFTITGNSAIDAAKAEIDVELDSIQEEIVDIAKPVTFSSIPMLCGQPMILFGNGTPQESIVPTNWIQFLDGGYNWTGLPSALGQVYINTAVNSGGHYTAVWNGYVLKWVNS